MKRGILIAVAIPILGIVAGCAVLIGLCGGGCHDQIVFHDQAATPSPSPRAPAH